MEWKIAKKGDRVFARYERDIYRLRCKVFKELLNWDVQASAGEERDEFDEQSRVAYALAVGKGDGRLLGCMRLLPTRGDYMLEKVFPALLLPGQEAPKREGLWELSRFAVDPQAGSRGGLGFDRVALALIAGICEHAREEGIDAYVAVTTPGMGKMVRRLGMAHSGVGRGIRIGNTNVVALEVKMDAQSFAALEAALAREGMGSGG